MYPISKFTTYGIRHQKLRKFVEQVGGWTQDYAGLTYVTVRGAGHEVPLHKPKLALALVKAFLSGNSTKLASA